MSTLRKRESSLFESHKTSLHDLLRSIHNGRLQLPEFQRDYVWDDSDVRGLIASIARGFPVGALLTLETGGEVKFQPRAVEGAPTGDQPDTLLLDGQQRMTSLYQSLFSKHPTRTPGRGKKTIDRHYFFDMQKAVSEGEDMQDALEWTPEDRIRRNPRSKEVELDASTETQQFENHLFPLDKVFDSKDWFFGYRDYWRDRNSDQLDLERQFDREVLDRITRYEMPVIRLSRDNSREAICLIFEKVNVGGKKLDAFELVTAIFAGEGEQGFDLRQDWKTRRATFLHIREGAERSVLVDIDPVNFLQAVTFMYTRDRRRNAVEAGKSGRDLPEVSIKRKDVLALPFLAYQEHADAVTRGFERAAKFLAEQKMFWSRDVPYPPQIVALAAFFAAFGKSEPSAPQFQKLELWFWSIALGEEYGSSTETKIARDVVELLDWMKDIGPGPRTMREAEFNAGRLETLRMRVSAAYKALHALLMKEGCRDFVLGRTTEVMTSEHDEIDIHHVFPRAWCNAQGLEPDIYDSILNKTPLSSQSNKSIGGAAPSEYLAKIESKTGVNPATLDTILRSHLIEPNTLRADNFESFIAHRRIALMRIIGNAMYNGQLRSADSVQQKEAS